jgi:hypothetical protein
MIAPGHQQLEEVGSNSHAVIGVLRPNITSSPSHSLAERRCCGMLQAAQLETLSGAFARQQAECERLQEQLEGSNGALVGLTAEVNCLKAQLQEGERREIEQRVRLPANACQLQLQQCRSGPAGLHTMHPRCSRVCDSCSPGNHTFWHPVHHPLLTPSCAGMHHVMAAASPLAWHPFVASKRVPTSELP